MKVMEYLFLSLVILRRVIGCLMYVVTYTRPDIAFVVRKLSRYPSVLEGYIDASWTSNAEDSSSTSGWVFLLEFMALAATGKEAKWLKNLILEIPLWSKPIAPNSIHCDSAATLAKAYSQMYNEKFRHLGVMHNMIREIIMNGVALVVLVALRHLRKSENGRVAWMKNRVNNGPGSMVNKFGPIFTIKLGVHRVLVVSNSEMAKECLTTNDKVFASRPKSMAREIMGYNYAMFAFAPCGSYWRDMRKIVVLELVSHRRL
ncbi:zinc finger, CCHC-type containing protein [Tanacetum coccineum]